MFSTRQNKQDGNAVPVAALLSGAVIWGLLWYPYRLLDQAQIHGAAATAITYAMALLMGLLDIPQAIQRIPGIWRSATSIVLDRIVCRLD